MLALTKDDIAHRCDFDAKWAKRDFVYEASNYVRSSLLKALIVSGLRGTGKTTGMYQLAMDFDALYLCAEKGEQASAEDYARLLQEADKKLVILDEYTWIQNRKDAFLDNIVNNCVQHGKKVILTGTESANLESLRHKELIHRAECLHVTRFSFEEFQRIHQGHLPSQPKQLYDSFLKEGGIFYGYVNKTAKGMDDYIQNSIIDNLYSYIGNASTLPREEIATAVYTVLYDAVRDVMSEKVPGEEFTFQAREKLSRLGVQDVDSPVSSDTIKSVGEILESIGVLVKVPNIVERKARRPEDDYRLYIVNPAITWNLAKIIYDPIKSEKRILAKLMEAAVLVDLASHKLQDDDLFFFENEHGEVDAVIAPNSGESDISLFEVKHRSRITSHDLKTKKWTILTGKAEEAISKRFPNNDVANRYFVYTGSPSCFCLKGKNGTPDKTFLLVGMDDWLHRYWDFQKNTKEILHQYGKLGDTPMVP